ncbi:MULTISPECIES: DUF397 domain-containing protein [Kitasatospora]|uniref:DUF397 domain-containing protein n=1 Tax=Kitasatospora setae (strain ATCC 33774 / DSM 43861 / JCM 3304 / KCC A-0304 / NBRC 14216 / KM-6054) TaxID=452652 RepID=E4NA69_KITSK|nr:MULTISPECIES: DUF397 domain-containing protein [Kitasatospora]BAJ28100.1 hypothetical protein KSE_22800 [Kitasatospora setae KM-6054]
MEIFNGMAADGIEAAAPWQKAQLSVGTGSCVEFRALDDGETVAVRNSRFPGGPALLFTRSEVEAMLDGARNGEFDHLAR